MKKILLVEGTDDQHVCFALFAKYSVEENFKVIEKGGIEKMINSLPVHLKESDVSTIGIMVDADTNLESRWDEIMNVLSKSGYDIGETGICSAGTIISQEDMPTVGVWIMPNNHVPGILEDFIRHLVPKDDVLLPYADSTIFGLPRTNFSDSKKSKALIHTWLAWQEDPGTPLGLAITKKYLSEDCSETRNLIGWINRLFGTRC